jgi:tRNA pseudouridine38-40 synthase
MNPTLRYRGKVAYNGSRFSGFQRQAPGILTIQEELEKALQAITGQHITVIGAGRTDSGVHALGQVISFDCPWRHPVEALRRAINAQLSPEIVLWDLQIAPANFHPRFSALRRTYAYHFYTAPHRNPLKDSLSWYIGPKLNFGPMQSAARSLLGRQDFATFGTAPQGGPNTIRTVYLAHIKRGRDGDHQFRIQADAFLAHMVRNIMGSLMAVGWGDWSLPQFAAALAAKQRAACAKMAPPHGLVLESVQYPDEIEQNAEQVKTEHHESENLDSQSH